MNKTQAIVFFGIIVIGAIFSVFTLTRPTKTPDTADTETVTTPATATKTPSVPTDITKTAPVEESAKKMAADNAKPPSTSTEKKEASSKSATSAIPPGGFKTEKALMDALTKAIKDKNPDLLFELAGQTALNESVRSQLTDLLKKDDLQLDLKQPLSAIGRTQNSMRWAIRLVSPSNEVIEILTDLTNDPESGWKISKIRLPDSEKIMTASSPAAGPSSEASEHPDALMIAFAFSKAAINRDIKTARSLTNPDLLNSEKLAALLIALEEGSFRLKSDKPLVVTLTRDDLSWAITRVESDNFKSEFGVEMNLTEDGRWAVSGLTFSKLISATATAAGAGDVAYSPLRKNPEGGESLVLYFEFDNEKVSARTQKQLTIVAELLIQQADRKIHINGHADAKGEDDYNTELSKRRTNAVKSTLIELGVNPGQIITKAFGETMPLKPNFKSDGSDNPDGRAQNRRTEIFLDF